MRLGKRRYQFLLMIIFGVQVNALQKKNEQDKEIIFGQSAVFSGRSAGLGIELWRGSQAYFDQVNAAGGVNGKKIRIISLDDKYEGDIALPNTIELINKHKVFGLFGYVGTPTIVKALPAVQKFSSEGVFLFSNFTGAQPQREPPHNKYVYNIRASYRQETEALIDLFIKNNLKKIGVFIQNDAYGKSGLDGVKRALQKRNLNMIIEVSYPRGTSFEASMKDHVEILKKAGVDAVISVGAYAACAAFIRDSRMSGMSEVPIANVSFVGADALLDLLIIEEKKVGVKLTENLLVSQVVPPWDDLSYPLVREYKEAVDKYNPQLPEKLNTENYEVRRYSFGALEGYLNAKILVKILRNMKGILTRENFILQANKLQKYDAGVGELISFQPHDHQAMDHIFITKIVDRKYTVIKNAKDLSK